MEPHVDRPVSYETLKKDITSDPVSDYVFIVVLESESSEGKYCLVPPFDRCPFAANSLKDTKVRLYHSIPELSNAIRGLPDSVRVDAVDASYCQPSRYPLRALTRKEVDEIKTLLEKR